ncbi:MAG: Ppx/GppA family phosphatase [Alphaproteobacteria bacterium]|nr:Ppx/GppA family phosphatase [Alphaproteobacteria bacterium]
MLVARRAGRGFRVIDAFSRATRLGEGVAESGRLTVDAMDRTVEALKQCAAKLERRGVLLARHVATEACRRAVNCREFVARVTEETGIALEIITPEEEARLALAGCAPLLDRRVDHAVVFDIGGGSTELMWVRVGGGAAGDAVIEAMASVPVGVVSLAEQQGERLESVDGFEAVVARVAASFAAFDRACGASLAVAAGSAQMLGTSGTVTTLAAVHLGLPRYDRAAVDGLTVSFSSLRRVTRTLVGLDYGDRALHPCIGDDRVELVLAGCAILEAICRTWPVGRLRVADRGVREGILFGLMEDDETVRA